MPPVLAADIENIIGGVCVAIWILAWLLKLVGKAQKAPPVANRPRPPARPRDERLQEEIDIFIQEVGSKKTPRRPPVAAPARPAPPQTLARPASIPGNPVARGQKSQKAPAPAKPAPAKKSAARARPGDEIASRHKVRPEADLGNAVQQHLQQHMAERVAQEASVFLQDKVDKSVAEHLGSATQAPSPGKPAAAPAARIAELFRNPATVRQAVIASLILAPPPGRAGRSAR